MTIHEMIVKNLGVTHYIATFCCTFGEIRDHLIIVSTEHIIIAKNAFCDAIVASKYSDLQESYYLPAKLQPNLISDLIRYVCSQYLIVEIEFANPKMFDLLELHLK